MLLSEYGCAPIHGLLFLIKNYKLRITNYFDVSRLASHV